MMLPRLYLIKELLSEDGIIFVSVDDNELYHLQLLMHEVFEGRFIANIIWKSRQHVDSRSKNGVSSDHEYILAYSGYSDKSSLRGKERDETKYKNPDNDPRGDWMSRSILGLADVQQRPNLHYDLIDPYTNIAYPCPPNTGWRYSKETMSTLIQEGRILFPAKPEGRPREKVFLRNLQTAYMGFPSVITNIFTDEGTTTIRRIFGEDKQVFSFPKPPSLIRLLLEQTIEEDDIVLDCTAGSGTTAHAVLQLNTEDDGNRRFILTQQKYDSKDDEKKDLNICEEITRERIKRVIEGKGTPALGGSFSYARLSDSPVLGVYRDLDPLPSYEKLARMVFYTHTSQSTDEALWNRESGFLGEWNGEAIFLLYDPHVDIELGLEKAWLEAYGQSDPRFHLVVYAEKFSMHRDDLREWCEQHGKTVKHLLVPYEIK